MATASAAAAPAAVALLRQGVLEPGEVRADAVLGRQLHREVDREPVGVVEPEGDRAGVINGFAHSNDHAARQLAAEMTKKVL